MVDALNGTHELSVPLVPWQYLRRGPDMPSWHPKITPHRLIVLSTTVILGSAKALLTERGSTMIPITLEWLTGTVLFLLFFSVSAYESRGTIPPSLSWLFDKDCMELVWSLREFLSGRSRPRYFSDEKPAIVDGYTDQPPITAYRILVCSAVISFGASKAVLSYSDLSDAVAWTDWALAVPVTTLLYILGLYEYNSSNIWSDFFIVDRSQGFHAIGARIAQTFGFSLCIGWILVCGWNLWYISDLGWGTLYPEGQYQATFRTRINDLTNFAWALFWRECMILGMIGGAVVLFVFGQPFFEGIAGVSAQVFSATFRQVVQAIKVVIPSVGQESRHARTWRSLSRHSMGSVTITTFRILTHFAIHFSLLIGCFTVCMTSLFCAVMLFDLLRESAAPPGLLIWFFILPGIFVILALGSVFLSLKVAYFLMKPALYWYEGKRPNDNNNRSSVLIVSKIHV